MRTELRTRNSELRTPELRNSEPNSELGTPGTPNSCIVYPGCFFFFLFRIISGVSKRIPTAVKTLKAYKSSVYHNIIAAAAAIPIMLRRGLRCHQVPYLAFLYLLVPPPFFKFKYIFIGEYSLSSKLKFAT